MNVANSSIEITMRSWLHKSGIELILIKLNEKIEEASLTEWLQIEALASWEKEVICLQLYGIKQNENKT